MKGVGEACQSVTMVKGVDYTSAGHPFCPMNLPDE
jgi:hypothetical protein